MMLRGVDPTASAGSNVEWSLSTPKPQSAMGDPMGGTMGGMGGMGMGMGDPMGGMGMGDPMGGKPTMG